MPAVYRAEPYVILHTMRSGGGTTGVSGMWIRRITQLVQTLNLLQTGRRLCGLLKCCACCAQGGALCDIVIPCGMVKGPLV